MDDEVNRDLDRASGEQAAARAGAMHRDDDEPTTQQLRPDETERTPEPGGEPRPAQAGRRTPGPVTDGSDLLGSGELATIRDRWDGLQAMFVDDPAGAARQADTLVGEVLDHLQRRHRALHDETGREAGGQADTEVLRAEFLRYRSFFRALLG